MAHRSALGHLRGKDGRSLVRALVVLILLNLLAGGFNTGAAAAAGTLVLCSVEGSPDGWDGAAGRHRPADCCFAGLTPLGMAAPTVPPDLAVPAILAEDQRGPTTAEATHGTFHGRASARGPPPQA